MLMVALGSVRTNVSRNAFTDEGKPRGVSDEVIDNGMASEVDANRIAEAVVSGKRELVMVEGMEAEAARLRRS